MKLRIKGNSLRLRISRSEMDRLVESGRIEDTVQFTPVAGESFTYSLEHERGARKIAVRYAPGNVAVVVPTASVMRWTDESEVGIYDSLALDASTSLELILEKDFACIDGSDADNTDTFQNPNEAAAC
ncbi:DUF7009 family protein [Granulicella sibirica]|uniref:Uncharacterized protein n=1 Tax=Granulicella sibirica TaxID=2479048 RepID=A0A4Q0T4D9_9BACT|nr:hypothetical protein [Granulicella sibirica]RXH57812.1 hypothetical protein GRAN_1122 [Granulicella sibirica]